MNAAGCGESFCRGAAAMLLVGSVVHAPMTFADDGCDESDDECMVVTGPRIPGPAGPSFNFDMEGMMEDLLRWHADMTNLLPPGPPVDDGCDVEDCIVVRAKRVTNSKGILLERYRKIDCYKDLVGAPSKLRG